MNTQVIVMAAGEGKRMKSKTAKVLTKANFKCMIDYVLQAGAAVSAQTPIVIVGHKAEDVQAHLGDQVRYALQNTQLGTGHAVMQAVPFLKENMPKVTVILNGDTPLITGETLQKALSFHTENSFQATVLGASFDKPDGYGRLVLENGKLKKIVEHKDATDQERQIREINAGMYFFDTAMLLTALEGLTNNNAQGEYYLTDTIELIQKAGGKTGAYIVSDKDEIYGCNSRAELAYADAVLRRRVCDKLMADGVSILNPDNTYISDEAKIGRDTVIYPGCVIEGKTVIGEDCVLTTNCAIKNCVIDDRVTIQSSTLLDSSVGADTTVGPYAYVRPQSKIGEHVKIGDFVEVKKSEIGNGTKISHLTYVGDAKVGERVNFGCGTVTVNYDGKNKFLTEIGNDAFIGCNTNLVAPVKVNDGAFIAAGSTITDEIPENAFAIARSRQVNKEGWTKPKNR